MADAGLLERTADFLRPVLPRRFRGDIPVVPVVRLTGVIGFSTPLRPGLTLANVAKQLDRAFAWPRARAVALSINSPGGSAVQSHLVFQRIRHLAAEKKKPVFAFVEDVAASGGYMIACAADENRRRSFSIVGSIGVIGASFGFTKLIEKIGIERRNLYVGCQQGDARSIPAEIRARRPSQGDQEDIHATFIDLVNRARRQAQQSEPACFRRNTGQAEARNRIASPC